MALSCAAQAAMGGEGSQRTARPPILHRYHLTWADEFALKFVFTTVKVI